MSTNLERYKADLKKLIDLGNDLLHAMQFECYPSEFTEQLKKHKLTEEQIKSFRKKLPTFNGKYQSWYSEAFLCVKQLLPDRLSDFVKLYEKPKTRKEIGYENYVIEDYLINLRVTRGLETKVDTSAAIPKFQQQLEILKAIPGRFESSLFDIKQLVQADLFDSELDSASELLKNGFMRAAGAVAGVVLEKHLRQVCNNHNLPITKKYPTIADLNDLLKSNNIIEVASWRHIQHMGDLRNLADHNKNKEPKKEEMDDLISGVSKITKNIF
ncbi:MAG: hypothetical protein BGO70_01080 [Bacteroidetes bacterium 43-93]|uniref:hypothetical protein n=1 Tax=uncultured Dysgonomonas sp. TaxID=206096 RepID=UPI00092705D6|nr:hypothetical protein [uncultured Dysgonomonas sp.]MBN9483128.1 hypothetical protein [Bacteroidota bacterium]OJW96305.1 MAG: hypothetical protein BGO70_01080 [Bacteroidetes bacterium 43-93]